MERKRDERERKGREREGRGKGEEEGITFFSLKIFECFLYI